MKHLRNILIALSLLLVSSWAPGPPQVSENTPGSSDDSIQHQTDGSGSGTTLVFPDYVDGGGQTRVSAQDYTINTLDET